LKLFSNANDPECHRKICSQPIAALPSVRTPWQLPYDQFFITVKKPCTQHDTPETPQLPPISKFGDRMIDKWISNKT